nr:PREDICTED: bZIP transcription factor 53-like isoform X2 [Musa acuminata subsp. malaccensis]
MRKQQRLEYLTSTVVQMRNEKTRMVALVAGVTQQRRLLESENSVLRAQAVEFAERLQSLSSVLRLVDDVRGAAMEDVSEIPPPVPGLWQSPLPGVPILASADVFECC